MADRKYSIDFEMGDGSTKSVEFTSPQGEPGATGSCIYTGQVTAGYDDEGNPVTIVSAIDGPFESRVGDLIISSDSQLWRVEKFTSEGVAVLVKVGDIRGLSAYEIAVEHGYEGTEAEWLAQLNPSHIATLVLDSIEQAEDMSV